MRKWLKTDGCNCVCVCVCVCKVLTTNNKESKNKDLHHVYISTVCRETSDIFIPSMMLRNLRNLMKFLEMFF